MRLLPNFSNADSAEVSGVDLTSSYRFDNRWGNWSVGLTAAWVGTYEVTVGSTTYDAVGSYNFSTPVARPLPEWKVNGTLSWSKDNHRAFMMVRYIDEVDEDIPAGTAGFFKAVTALAGNQSTANDMADGKIESMTTVDLQYNYNFGETAFLSDSNVTVGLQNVFDEKPPIVSYITANDPRCSWTFVLPKSKCLSLVDRAFQLEGVIFWARKSRCQMRSIVSLTDLKSCIGRYFISRKQHR